MRAARRFATVPQLAAQHPAFSVGALRWLLLRRQQNGLAAAVVKIGPRRLLIDVDRFERWLDSFGEQRRRGHH
jgi:hypothetical protein